MKHRACMIVSTIFSSVTGFHRRQSNDTGRNAELTVSEVHSFKFHNEVLHSVSNRVVRGQFHAASLLTGGPCFPVKCVSLHVDFNFLFYEAWNIAIQKIIRGMLNITSIRSIAYIWLFSGKVGLLFRNMKLWIPSIGNN